VLTPGKALSGIDASNALEDDVSAKAGELA
jgi:hypothetical protein